MHRPTSLNDRPDGHAVIPVQSPTTPVQPIAPEISWWERWLETDPAVWQRVPRTADATWTVRGAS